MCVITEVLERLTHSPGIRRSYKEKTGPVPGNLAAVRGQAAFRSIPGTEGSDSHAESKQLQCFETLPHSCLSGLSAGGCPRAEATEWDGCLGLSCPSSGPEGMHGEGRRRTGAAAAWAPTPPPQTGEAPLAQGQSVMEGTPMTVPGKLIRAHLLGPSANRFLLCFPIAPWDFFPRVCPLLPLSLPSCPYWSSSISHFPPLRKVYAQEKASGTGSHATGAGGGQPELQPALPVSRDTKQGCRESCSFMPCLLAFFLAF